MVRDRSGGIGSDRLGRLLSKELRSTSGGLGLAISRTIVEAHGGRLLATNDPAGGATFRIHLRTDQPPTT